MSVSLSYVLTTSSFLLISILSSVSSQLSPYETYVTHRVRSPFSDLGTVSGLFGANRTAVAMANNLSSEDAPLEMEELLLIPITCVSNGMDYFSNVTYQINTGETLNSLWTRTFQNLTEYLLVQEMNPALDPSNLTVGADAVFPLLCSCPGNLLAERGIKYLITYVWQPGDDVSLVSAMFRASASNVVRANNNRNLSTAAFHPVLIPVESPILLQHFPSVRIIDTGNGERTADLWTGTFVPDHGTVAPPIAPGRVQIAESNDPDNLVSQLKLKLKR